MNLSRSSKVSNSDEYAEKCWDMVENQIISRGIKNPIVLDAMLKVKRHLFVPEQYLDSAYVDKPIPIEEGQTVSQPYIVALMTDLLTPEPGKRILEIGTGSGYQTAILAEIGCQVYTIEIIENIAIKTRKILDGLGYSNIEFKIADGYLGWTDNAPFEAIIVTAAPKEVPELLLDQLSDGGKLIIPVGDENQHLLLVEKNEKEITKKKITSVRFVPMTGSSKSG